MKEDTPQDNKSEDLDADIADFGKPLPNGLGDALWNKIKARTIDLKKEISTPSLEREIEDKEREI